MIRFLRAAGFTNTIKNGVYQRTNYDRQILSAVSEASYFADIIKTRDG